MSYDEVTKESFKKKGKKRDCHAFIKIDIHLNHCLYLHWLHSFTGILGQWYAQCSVLESTVWHTSPPPLSLLPVQLQWLALAPPDTCDLIYKKKKKRNPSCVRLQQLSSFIENPAHFHLLFLFFSFFFFFSKPSDQCSYWWRAQERVELPKLCA